MLLDYNEKEEGWPEGVISYKGQFDDGVVKDGEEGTYWVWYKHGGYDQPVMALDMKVGDPFYTGCIYKKDDIEMPNWPIKNKESK